MASSSDGLHGNTISSAMCETLRIDVLTVYGNQERTGRKAPRVEDSYRDLKHR
jgi:hypothetical protein